jgi:hypothetical protein
LSSGTYHQTNGYSFSVGRNLVTSPTGVSDIFNFGNGNIILANTVEATVFNHANTVGGSENVVMGRNMVVRGNSNFSAGTDGTISSTSNYSASFGDANDVFCTACFTTGFGNDNYVENGFVDGSDNVNGALSAGTGTANQYGQVFMFGLRNRGTGQNSFYGGTYLQGVGNNIIMFGQGVSAVSPLAVSTASSFSVGFSKTSPDFQITTSKVRMNLASLQEYKGSNATAANDLSLTGDGNLYTISGATTINAINAINWQAGSKVSFIFTGAPLVKNNTAGGAGTAPMLLAGRTDFQAAAGDVLYLEYDGTNWYEINRALAAGSATITADNGLNKNTATNVQLGTTSFPGKALIQSTQIDASSFPLTINSNTGGVTSGLQSTNFGGGIGANFGSVDGIGAYAQSLSATNNTVGIGLVVGKEILGPSGANGIGTKIQFRMNTVSVSTGNTGSVANEISSTWLDATDATKTSQISVTGTNSTIGDTLLVMGGYIPLTESSATKFTSTTIANSRTQGGEIVITIEANDGTDFQARTMRFIWSAVNKGGTLTITVNTPEEVVAISSGTLTCTITAVDAGSGVLDFKANAVSSLTQTILRCTYQAQKNF